MATIYFIVTADHKSILSDCGFIPMENLGKQMSHILGFTTPSRAEAIMRNSPSAFPGCSPFSDLTLQRVFLSEYPDVFLNPMERIGSLKKMCIRNISMDQFYKNFLKPSLPNSNLNSAECAPKPRDDTADENAPFMLGDGNVILFSQNECAQVVLVALDSMIHALNSIQNVDQQAYDQICKLDDAINDEMHYVEMHMLSAPKGYLAYRRLRELRRQRRVLKDQVECAGLVYELFGEITVEKLQEIKQSIKDKDNRRYRLREPELFLHDQAIKGENSM